MKVKLKYFGMLTDVTAKHNEEIDFDQETIAELVEQLNDMYPGLGNMDFKVAVNQEIVELSDKLNNGEVALLPPFSGG